MPKESDAFLNIVGKIPTRDKEVILLASIFFWGKYTRRRVNSDGFEPVIPEVDFNDPISILTADYNLRSLENSDIEGDAVGAISTLLSKHPMRAKLFSYLDDREIRRICSKLDDIFEEQEFCAQCEAWSYYDETRPEDFAIDVANTMLYLQGRYIGLSWFTKIRKARHRSPVIKAVLKEKLSGGISGFLLPGGNEGI